MHIYSSLSQSKKEFTHIQKTAVKIYVCGITPYDTTHLGHAFLYTFFDTAVRYFAYRKFPVIYTQNVTDVDDDLLLRAKRDDMNWIELGNLWTKRYLHDMRSLNILPPTHFIKATDSIPEIIEIVTRLIERKFAYEVNGTVFFDVSKTPSYGQLSNYTEDEMILFSKERGADPYDARKRNPLDFILWQKSLANEPFWESPWGNGRPGWHIECSAMAYKTLGTQITIHGGGFDLIYPHHESELVQSEGFTGKIPFSEFWMHVGMLSYDGDKMSKSLGNLILVSDLLKTYSANAIRWLLLSHHYRQEWEYFDKDIDWAQAEVNRVVTFVEKEEDSIPDKAVISNFQKLMEDDFNTPEVLKFITQCVKMTKSASTIKEIMNTLGFVI